MDETTASRFPDEKSDIKIRIIASQHFEYVPDKPEICIRYHVADPENSYDMIGFPRGVVVIFNMREFEQSTGIENYTRFGTDKDAEDIKDVFLKLGFVVHRFDNVSKKELSRELDEITKDCRSMSCFACFILSHGHEGEIYTRDGVVKLTDIFTTLETPDWLGKPKLFFIQACQGGKYMDAIEPEYGDATDAPPKQDQLTPLPKQSDFLYAYSTVDGYSSWRNTEYGSWFIQELCQSFRSYSHTIDVSRILTRANKGIANRATCTASEETHNKRQISSIINQLRKDVYLYPPNGPLDNLLAGTNV